MLFFCFSFAPFFLTTIAAKNVYCVTVAVAVDCIVVVATHFLFIPWCIAGLVYQGQVDGWEIPSKRRHTRTLFDSALELSIFRWKQFGDQRWRFSTFEKWDFHFDCISPISTISERKAKMDSVYYLQLALPRRSTWCTDVRAEYVHCHETNQLKLSRNEVTAQGIPSSNAGVNNDVWTHIGF